MLDDEEDSLENALADELAREYGEPSFSGKSMSDINGKGYNFWGAGCLSLEEARKMLARVEAGSDYSEVDVSLLKSGFKTLLRGIE